MANNVNYGIGLQIDTSGLKQGSSQVNSYLNGVQQNARQMSRNVNSSLNFNTSNSVSSINNINSSITGVSSNSGKMAGIVDRSFSNISASAASVKNKIDLVKGSILGITGSLAATGGAILAFTHNASESAFELQNMAELSGTSVEEFQRLAYASRTVGIEQDKLSDIFKDAQDRVGDFIQTGGGPMADFFENIAPKIGVTAKEFQNLSGSQVMQKYVKGLQDANVNQEDFVFYLEAMASDSTLLRELFANNSAELNKLTKEADRLNVVVSNADNKTLVELNNEYSKLSNVLGGNLSTLAATFSTEITNGLRNAGLMATNLVNNIRDLKKEFQGLESFDLGYTNQKISENQIELERRSRGNDRGFGVRAMSENPVFGALGLSDFAKKTNPDILKTTKELTTETDKLNKKRDELIEKANKAYNTEQKFNKFASISTSFTQARIETQNKYNSSLEDMAKIATSVSGEIDKYGKSISQMGYETQLGTEKIKEIISDINNNDSYSFYDNISQKVNAYIKDNDLQVKSNKKVASSESDLEKSKKSVIETIQDELSALQKSNAVFGKAESEVIKYRIANGDLKDAMDLLGQSAKPVVSEILKLQKSLETKEANKNFKDTISDLNFELKSLDLNGKDLIKLEVSNEFKDDIKTLGADGKKAAESISDLRYQIELKNSANGFIEDSKSEVEQLTERLQKLKEVQSMIGEDRYSNIEEGLSSSLENAKIQADDFLSFMQEAGSDIRSTFTDAFAEGLDGNFEGMFDSLQNTIRRKVAEILADQALSRLSGMFSNFGMNAGAGGGTAALLSGLFGGRSAGGYMSPNTPYIVGEKGPELVYPKNPSSVLNAQNFSGNQSPNNIAININGNLGNDENSRRSVAKIRSQVAKGVIDAQRRGDV